PRLEACAAGRPAGRLRRRRGGRRAPVEGQPRAQGSGALRALPCTGRRRQSALGRQPAWMVPRPLLRLDPAADPTWLAFFLVPSRTIIPRRIQATSHDRRGFSLADLSGLLAVTGSLCALTLPAFLSYFQTAQVRAAAEDVASQLNLGRQMAIQRNQSVCVS